jgi:hypothetical protein
VPPWALVPAHRSESPGPAALPPCTCCCTSALRNTTMVCAPATNNALPSAHYGLC